MSRGTADPDANRLLAALSDKERRRLLPTLVSSPLRALEVLYEFGRPIKYVHFMQRGTLVHLTRHLGDGRSFDAALVGYDGMSGVEISLGGDVGLFTSTVLAGGESLRMDAGALRSELRQGSTLTPLVNRYAQFLLFQVSQISGCNRFHSVEVHFCSRLLLAHDLVGSDQIEITHAVFSRMLGVRRVSITQVARKLHGAGLIRYRWGKVSILDRRGLEKHACVCHKQIKEARRQMLNFPNTPANFHRKDRG